MKNLWVLIAATMITTSAFADNCVGNESLYSCTDGSGNTYNVNKIGTNTYMTGRNNRTGSQWNQNSSTIGNQTFMNGTDSNGKRWNGNISNYGGSTNYSGSDSDGNHYNKTCNQFGCF